MERAYLPGCRRISTRISYFETRCCSSPRPGFFAWLELGDVLPTGQKSVARQVGGVEGT